MTIDDIMHPRTVTATQVEASLAIVRIVADAIREITLTNENGLGGVPSGHLYAQLTGHLTLSQYQSVIDLLKRAELIEEKEHLLTWVGPRS